MFYAFIQLGDLLVLGTVGLFLVFYILTWSVLAIRLSQSKKYSTPSVGSESKSISVIMPVADEKPGIFDLAVRRIIRQSAGLDVEFFIVLNGSYNESIKKIAENFAAEHEFVKVLHSGAPGKRNAIAVGVQNATKEITVLLDSDSVASSVDTLLKLSKSFHHEFIGGVVTRQAINNRNDSIIRRLCDWYEDIRFNNTTPGLSYHGAIPCLIGRLYAVRTSSLRRYMPEFINQKVLGLRMETGDDRVITSMLLKDGYETRYIDDVLVWTDAPDTIGKFAKQRLRWSRSSFRETLLSINWLWRFPYAFFIMWADIVLRWMFLAVVVLFAYRMISGNLPAHFVDLSWAWYLTIGVIGFFVSGLLKQLPHLRRYPEDLKYTPLFLLLNLFVLFPVEIYGNLTCLKQGWLTRRTK